MQTPNQAVAAVDQLVDREHVQLIVGSYGSDIAIAAATRADQRHVVYWETGAVADEVTLHRRYVFRTVATGSTLGRMAARFTAQVLLPQAGMAAAQSRVVILHTTDPYGRSVADGEAAQAKADGIQVIASLAYDPRRGFLYVADSSQDRVVPLIIPRIAPNLVPPRPLLPPRRVGG